MANICVGPTSTGTGLGTDWSNKAQWSSVTFVRGNTYYLEDGAYASKTLNTANVTTVLITIKKATVADHASATGWSDTMGDGQAVITAPLNFLSNYWTIDGQGRSTNRSGYGIIIDNHTTPANITDNVLLGDTGPTAAMNVTLRYVEIYGSAKTDGSIKDAGITAAYQANCNSITVQYCWIHDVGQCPFQIRSVAGCTIEYCVIERNHSQADSHAEAVVLAVSSNITIRWNLFSDIEGSGYIATPFGIHNTLADLYIYGNVFEMPATPTRGGASGVIAVFDCDVTGAFKVYNNTILGIQNAKIIGQPLYNSCNPFFNFDPWSAGRPVSSTEFIAENNLWVDCDAVVPPDGTASHITTLTWSKNAYYNTTSTADVDANKQILGANILASWTSGTYTPSANTTAGVTLASPYDTDPIGATRTTWTRGAYEYNGTTTCADPTFSPVAGSYAGTQTVTLSTTTSGASIRYTVDGSTPSDTVGTVGTSVSVASSLTVKAIAYKSAMTNSNVASAAYTITAATVTFTALTVTTLQFS